MTVNAYAHRASKGGTAKDVGYDSVFLFVSILYLVSLQVHTAGSREHVVVLGFSHVFLYRKILKLNADVLYGPYISPSPKINPPCNLPPPTSLLIYTHYTHRRERSKREKKAVVIAIDLSLLLKPCTKFGFLS